MRPAPGSESGFTLVEILVVVAIAGIVLALAVVNLAPSDTEVAKREAGLVALALEEARDAAWFGGTPVAVSFDEGRLRRWRLAGERRWEPDARLDRPLGEVQVASLHLEGEPLPANARLIFMPDGFGIPFRIGVTVRGHERAIEGDPAGAVVVRER